MEVLHRRVEEEGVVEQLQTRRQRPDFADPSDDITSSSSDEDSANVMNDGYKSEEKVDKNGISEKSVYLDKEEGKNLRAEEVDIPELVNAVINNQNGENITDEILSVLSTSTPRSEEENIGTRVGANENVRIDLVEESYEEVIELEFERAVEKVHTHTPHCPNCNYKITKVTLRRRKREESVRFDADSHRRDKPIDLFGCLKCFSIFIPSGNGLNPFRIFGSNRKQESTEIVDNKHTSEANLPVSAGGSTNADGSTPINQGNAFDLFWIFRKRRENENKQDSQGSDQVKHEGGSNNEEENLETPGRHPEITPPHPSLPSEVKIDIGDEKDGISGEVTTSRNPEGEIEEQSNKPQPRPEPDDESRVKSTTEERGETDVDVANQAAISGNGLNPFRIFGSNRKQESTEIVDNKHTSEANFPVSAGGSTNAEGSTPINQGNAFDLFWIFRKRRQNENKQDSRGSDQVKHEGESNNEEENLKKLERHPGIAPPHPSLPSEVKIDIGEETDGISGGVTASRKPEGEIEEQSNKPQPRAEPDEESRVKSTTEERGETDVDVAKQAAISGTHGSKSLEILKCIVYGGLVESITSLSVVSSAAASDATTLNIIAIGLATVFSGLIVFGHNLMDLRNNVSGGNSNQRTDRYQELLGRRGHFLLHATFAIFSYLLFGLIPPITYGFTFRESHNKDSKILAVAAASFTCVFILAIAKAYVRRTGKFSDYVKTILSYVTMAICVSGVAYAAGDLIKMLMEKLGWFEPTQAATSFIPEMISATPAWASH